MKLIPVGNPFGFGPKNANAVELARVEQHLAKAKPARHARRTIVRGATVDEASASAD
jgi:hypothetical protein